MTVRSVITFCVLVLAGIGLHFAPNGVCAGIRGTVTDALRPGQYAARVAAETVKQRSLAWKESAVTNDDIVVKLTEELEIERERVRILQTKFAQSAERDLSDREISAAMRQTIQPNRLIVPEIIEVAVLGDTVSELWRAGKLLDHGAKNGLREDELVLSTKKSSRPLIDFGEDAEISTEDPLLLGRCVIGKIENVGRWTSTFQLVTDSRYRGRAQVIRETESGFVFEAQGILKGQGEPLCKLEGIPSGKSIRVNDAVYSADRDGILPTPLYYGQVVKAVLGANDREWTVYVKPAELPSHLTMVQVLRTAINPERLVVK